MASRLFVGVAGGTGCGKTTLCRQIVERVGPQHIAFLQLDSYYHDQSHLPPPARAALNYDHPDRLDTALIASHLERLRRGDAIEVPTYDFATHTRQRNSRTLNPAPIVLVEGILILADRKLRELLDVRVFVESDADVRLIRRLERDKRERGRTPESVIAQYLATVRPMHLEFVAPSRRFADVIVPGGGLNEVALDLIVSRIRSSLPSRGTG